ncbi:MAG: Sir2 family NAD+-dependent deacetylase [Pseudohongiellaceae bacterium]
MTAQPKSVVVLTGAGISAESGIKTFRGADGLWENHRVEEVASPEGFASNPVLVYEFYNQRRRQLLSGSIKPNPAHTALAHFEREFAGEFLLITQNIDNLHERAGSDKLLHLHGELLKMRCLHTQQVYDIREDLDQTSECRCCQATGSLRPHIVWFGEMPFHIEQIANALSRCDLFISIGTSGNVYPAAGFYETAKQAGARTVEINLEPTGSRFDEHIYGKASAMVPDYLQRLLQ